MKAQGGYPANRRRASAANNFTPALNNITGKTPGDKTKVFIGKGGQNQKMKPYLTKGNKSVFKKRGF